jgi:ubiquinone/menaquinone biosynthesis C-methylase UbiE
MMSPSMIDRLFRAASLWLHRLTRFIVRFDSTFHKRFVKQMYRAVNLLDTDGDMVFMNYGYAPLDPQEPPLELRAEDEPHRYGLQLYHRVAGAVDLRGKDVLDVGCGRGGGSSFIVRYLHPRLLVGLDFSWPGLRLASRWHRLEGLVFLQGDAEALPFPPASFDVVINVESSHCYPSMERFLQEVARVLRPQGYFLLADLRAHDKVDVLCDQIRRSGLRICQQKVITPQVVRALELDSDRKLALIQKKVFPLIRPAVREFAAVKGSQGYEHFRTGTWQYLYFVLQKSSCAEKG